MADSWGLRTEFASCRRVQVKCGLSRNPSVMSFWTPHQRASRISLPSSFPPLCGGNRRGEFSRRSAFLVSNFKFHVFPVNARTAAALMSLRHRSLTYRHLLQQHHLPRLHELPRLQTVKIHSRRQIARVKTNGMNSRRKRFIRQHRHLAAKQIIHRQFRARRMG